MAHDTQRGPNFFGVLVRFKQVEQRLLVIFTDAEQQGVAFLGWRIFGYGGHVSLDAYSCSNLVLSDFANFSVRQECPLFTPEARTNILTPHSPSPSRGSRGTVCCGRSSLSRRRSGTRAISIGRASRK